MTTYTRPVQNQANGNTYVEMRGSDGVNNIGNAGDTAVTDSTASGSLIAFVKGLVKIWSDIWDGANHALVVTLGSALRATIDSMSVKIATDAIMNGNTELTPKFAKIVASASGVTQIVAAVTSKKIRVLAYVLQCNAAVNVKAQSHVTPTDLTGLLYNGVNTGASAGFNPAGWFETVAGEALDINLSGAVAVGGHLTYVEV